MRIVGADGEGCGFYRPGTVGTAGFLGSCGPLGSGGASNRLNTLLRQRPLTVEDSIRLDPAHLEVVVSLGAEYTDHWVLTCALPVQAAPDCVQNQHLAPGTLPFLIH